MSFFGKNIKKIRSVKGLSQQAFAELFDLKRGTLGAYEEGRSEPKIDTIIKIANYFSIQIDALLTGELTVNELLRFKGELTTYTQVLRREQFAYIPCITATTTAEYIEAYDQERFINELPVLQLPLDETKEYRGYTVSNLEMTQYDEGYYPNDIVIGVHVSLAEIETLSNGILVLVVTDTQLIFRRMYQEGAQLVLRADHKHIDAMIVPVSAVKEIWKVCTVFYHRVPAPMDTITHSLQRIEEDISTLKTKMV